VAKRSCLNLRNVEWSVQDEAARKQQQERAARQASKEADRQRTGDAIFVPFVEVDTPKDSQVRC
jgi:hypothetical protein